VYFIVVESQQQKTEDIRSLQQRILGAFFIITTWNAVMAWMSTMENI